MKTPCELIVWYVLPCIRRELAFYLVNEYNLTQTQTAKKLGVTDAAVSQYMKAKRGCQKEVRGLFLSDDIATILKESASKIASGESNVIVETCNICTAVKNKSLRELYRMYDPGTEYPFGQ